MLIQRSVAAATAILGYDLMTDSPMQTAPYARQLVAAALKGSAAALDTKIDIMVGTVKVGEMFNNNTGAPNRDDLFRIGSVVPAGTALHAYITDAPATNPINFAADLLG